MNPRAACSKRVKRSKEYLPHQDRARHDRLDYMGRRTANPALGRRARGQQSRVHPDLQPVRAQKQTCHKATRFHPGDRRVDIAASEGRRCTGGAQGCCALRSTRALGVHDSSRSGADHSPALRPLAQMSRAPARAVVRRLPRRGPAPAATHTQTKPTRPARRVHSMPSGSSTLAGAPPRLRSRRTASPRRVGAS